MCNLRYQEFNVIKEGRKKGKSIEQTRVRFEHSSGVSGWVSVKSREGKTLCELMGVPEEKLEVGFATPGSNGFFMSKSPFL